MNTTPPPPNSGTETPLTDAAQFMPSLQHPAFNLAQQMVKADFCRTLERRVNRLKGLLERARELLPPLHAERFLDGYNKLAELLSAIDAEGKE